MGADGADGLLRMKQAGARTIAQDEKSCVVFGMPREAIKIGAVERIVDIADVSQTALNMIA
jgi:two-component system chemotaxis response regulator CheB